VRGKGTKLGEGKGTKRGKGTKLGEGCPKVRLSQDRMPILGEGDTSHKCRSHKCRFAQMSLNLNLFTQSNKQWTFKYSG
jgi:hypothetical protein